MKLYGRTWNRREIESRMGNLSQAGGVRRLAGVEGPEAGVEVIQVRTGAGLAYTVTPMRGMDISLAEYSGVPLSWQSPNGDVHPAFYDPRQKEWLRTAAGGLLMTCGLTQVGSPCTDNGEELGQHGRVHHIPARQVCAEGRWQEDEYDMTVSGVVEETAIYGDVLRLQREIHSRLGENHIAIRDTVENLGFAPAPLMLLYHFNFGFPLLSEGTVLSFPSKKITPREAEVPLEGYDRWEIPQADYQERVYYHEDLKTENGDWATAIIHNPDFPFNGGLECKPLTLRLSWDTRTLPRFVEWKMPGAGIHVLGIEPANCHVQGRCAEREMGTLESLEPGERRQYQLDIEVTAE
ncbi:MAG: aldose 1-epimerase family protein [Omnitrophica WOR_2 bacterium]